MRPWRSWIARQTPTLKATGSNPAGRTRRKALKRNGFKAFLFCFRFSFLLLDAF